MTIPRPELLECTECPLHKLRKCVVPGEGPVPARVMVVGEGPGPQENLCGRPFVETAPAGKTLTRLLEKIVGISRRDVFIYNIVACMPTDDGKSFRAPHKKEKDACRHWLDETIEIVDPEVILAVGEHALQSFVPTTSLSKAHGLAFEVNGRKVVGLYHPSYYNRMNPQAKSLEEREKGFLTQLSILNDYRGVWDAVENPVRLPEFPWTLEVPRNPIHARKLLNILRSRQRWAFDFETTGLDPYTSTVVGVSFSSGDITIYIDLRNTDSRKYIRALRSFFRDSGITKVMFNAKYEIKFLMALLDDNDPVCNFEDPQLLAYLVDTQDLIKFSRDVRDKATTVVAPGLKELVLRKLNVKMTELEEVLGKGKKKVSIEEVDAEVIGAYGAADSYYTLRLLDYYLARIPEDLLRIYEEVDKPLVAPLARMEMAGAYIDGEAVKLLEEQLDHEIEEIRKRVFELCGEEFNLNSVYDKRRVLFEKLKLRSRAKTKKGTGLSTSAAVLERLAEKHEVPRLLLAYEERKKQRSTYTQNLRVHPLTGKVHTEFKQTSTITSRLSSGSGRGGLNLQNIPKKGERGKLFRKLFIAPPGWKIVKADASQEELRILAHYISLLSPRDPMVLAFQEGKDIHAETAIRVFGDRPDFKKNFDEYRYMSKTINFGVIYGLTPVGLSKNLNVSMEEANDIVEMLMLAYPGIEMYRKDCEEFLLKHGYITTILGRRIPVPSVYSRDEEVRNEAVKRACNYRIQGTGGEIIRLATRKVDNYILSKNLRSYISHEVHDEIVVCARKEEVDEIAALLRDALAPKILNIELVTEVEVGDSWGNTQPYTF